MTRAMGVLAAGIGLAMTVALAASSRVPWNPDSEAESLLVLSWRGVSESRDLCREPTAEDLAGLPSHMRPDRICEEAMAEYRLTLSLDDESLVDRVVSPAGARGDRPVYVLERIPVNSGEHQIAVAFSPTNAATTLPPGEAAGQPRGIAIQETVTFRPGHVVLVTRDGDRGEFVIRVADDGSP